MSTEPAQTIETEQVLEFRLGDETYCVDIDSVTEIVDMGDLTPIPNSPPQIQGVIDLRGHTTSIVDPKVTIGVEGELGERIIIFDSRIFDDERSIGWAVDSVEEVSDISHEEIDESPVEADHIHGLVKRDSEFVIWIDPRTMDGEGAGNDTRAAVEA